MVDIREVHDDDVADLVQLWTDAGVTRPWNDPRRDIAFARAGDNATILVGRAAGRLVASVMVGHDGHRGNVYYVCIAPDCRRKGYGRAIMEAAETWLRARGVWKLNLLVRDGNDSAVSFYEDIGFERQPRVYMEKWLETKPES